MPDKAAYGRGTLTIPLGEFTVSVPFHPADVWVEGLDKGPVGLLMHLIRRGTSENILIGLGAGEITDGQVADAAFALLKAAMPYTWWEAWRLLAVSRTPEVMGRLVLAGLDPRNMTAAMWASAVYALLTKNLDKAERFKFDANLSVPPEGFDDDEWGTEDFETMVQQARQMPGMS